MGGLGPQTGADLHRHEPLLAADAQGPDHGDLERVLPFLAGDLFQLDRDLLGGLGGLEKLHLDPLRGTWAAAGAAAATDHCRTLGSKTLTTL